MGSPKPLVGLPTSPRFMPQLGAELPRFLSQAYDFEAVADYEIGPDATLPLAEALAATRVAEKFVDRIAEKTQ